MAGDGPAPRPDRLTVAAAQPQVEPDDLAATVGHHVRLVEEASARLVVFPELSLTGYRLDADPLEPTDPRLAPLVDACDRTASTALVGAIVHDGARRIAVLEVTGAGVDVAYLKMSLGGQEERHVVAGTRPGVVVVDGWRIGVGVCKDTRMTAHLEATMTEAPDVYAAGLVHRADEHAELERRAVRIAHDHHLPVVLASHAGRAGHGIGRTAGGSGVWDAAARTLARAGTAAGEVVGAVVADRPQPQ